MVFIIQLIHSKEVGNKLNNQYKTKKIEIILAYYINDLKILILELALVYKRLWPIF